MAREQLKKAPEIMKSRRHIADMITSYMVGLPIEPSIVRQGCEHSYYCWTGKLRGVIKTGTWPPSSPFKRGYLRPLYDLPAFKQDIRLCFVEAVENHIVLVEICSIDPTNEEIIQMVEELGKAL